MADIFAIQALSELHERSSHEYVTPLAIAWIHLALGDVEATLTFFEAALDESSGPYHIFLGDSVYDPLRGTSRFRALLERLHLERWAEPEAIPQG